MSILFESLDEFNSALDEVKLLSRAASRNLKDEKKYKAYNKSAVILLTTKFEAFVENILDEFVEKYNNLGLMSKDLPNYIKYCQSMQLFEKICRDKDHPSKNKDVIDNLKSLSLIWDQNSSNKVNLDFTIKFSYGKHGETEIIKLFKNIGIDNIFSSIKITEHIDGVEREIDTKGKLNSIIGMRNNIIHTDATPSLTHNDVIKFTTFFEAFAFETSHLLQLKIPKPSSEPNQ